MLKNFLKRYPTGGLVSELVRVVGNRFIVRCLLQVNGVTIASALGTGDTVEMAEDNARIRALSLLEDLISTPTSTPSPPPGVSTSPKPVEVPPPPVLAIPSFPEPLREMRGLDSDAWLTTPLEHSQDIIGSIEPPPSPPVTDSPLTFPPLDQQLFKVEPTDNSDIIARTDVYIKRLGWTTKQGRDFLQERYGKLSRQLLSPNELEDFLQYLESQT